MSDRDVTQRIIAALADYLKRPLSSIEPDHHLRDDLGLDSMAVIELLYKIEEAFDIQIPDQDLASMATVASVAQYVNRRLTQTTQPAATHTRPAAKGKKKH